MKIIYAGQKIRTIFSEKEVERAEGIYDDVRKVFPDDQVHAKEMVDDLHDQEAEDNLLQEALQNGPSDVSELGIGPDEFSETFVIISDAISKGKDLQIGYYTYGSGIYIEREVRPEYIYHADTGNNILVTWCYDWNDYRAFVLDNIVFAEDVNANSTGEEQI